MLQGRRCRDGAAGTAVRRLWIHNADTLSLPRFPPESKPSEIRACWGCVTLDASRVTFTYTSMDSTGYSLCNFWVPSGYVIRRTTLSASMSHRERRASRPDRVIVHVNKRRCLGTLWVRHTSYHAECTHVIPDASCVGPWCPRSGDHGSALQDTKSTTLQGPGFTPGPVLDLPLSSLALPLSPPLCRHTSPLLSILMSPRSWACRVSSYFPSQRVYCSPQRTRPRFQQ